MPSTAEQIGKRTLVTRLAVSIYRMKDRQLALMLDALEEPTLGAPVSADGVSARFPFEQKATVRRQIMIARCFVLIKQLDQATLLERLRALKDPAFMWVRQFPRIPCYLLVDFATDEKCFHGCIRDISAGGVFIETTDVFQKGREVALCFAFSEPGATMPFKVKGRVVQLYPDGIGVQYEAMTHYRREILNQLIQKTC